MAKVSILLDEKHISDPVFEGVYFGSDNVDPHLIKHIDDIGKQTPLVFAAQMHDGIGLGVFAVDINIFGMDLWLIGEAFFVGIKCLFDDLFDRKDILFIHLGREIDLEIFELIEEFADIHVDDIEMAELAEQVAQVDRMGTDDLDGEIGIIADMVGIVLGLKGLLCNGDDPLDH